MSNASTVPSVLRNTRQHIGPRSKAQSLREFGHASNHIKLLVHPSTRVVLPPASFAHRMPSTHHVLLHNHIPVRQHVRQLVERPDQLNLLVDHLPWALNGVKLPHYIALTRNTRVWKQFPSARAVSTASHRKSVAQASCSHNRLSCPVNRTKLTLSRAKLSRCVPMKYPARSEWLNIAQKPEGGIRLFRTSDLSPIVLVVL